MAGLAKGCPAQAGPNGPERQREGIERAKGYGVYVGGQRRLDHERIRAMDAEGTGSAGIARAVGCSRMQVYRILNGAG